MQSQFPAIAQSIGRRSPGQQPRSAQLEQLLALTASAALRSVVGAVEAADSGSEVGKGECASRHDKAKTRNNKAKARSGQIPIALPKQRPAGL